MNKVEFVKRFTERKIAQSLGLNEEESTKIMDGIFDCLIDEVISKGGVEMPHLGRLMLRVRPESFGQNPLTGETLTISAENVVIFRPDFGKIPFPAQEITDAIIQETGIKKITPEVISDFFNLMLEVLQQEEMIKWQGFGRFSTYYQPEFEDMESSENKIVTSEVPRIRFKADNQLRSLISDLTINVNEIITNKILLAIMSDSLTQTKLQELVAQGEDINECDLSDNSTLSLICEKGELELARTMLELGADIDNKGKFDEWERPRPLNRAVKSGNLELVQFLLDSGADTFKCDAGGETIIMQAYSAHNIDLLLPLLKRKVMLEDECVDNDTPADVAMAIKKLVTADSDLKQYSEVLSLLDTIKVLDFALDCSGGNADDKVEIEIIELGNTNKYRLEYMYMFNWSYAESELMLKCKNNHKEKIILEKHNDDELDFTKDQVQALCELAIQLGLGNLTLKSFAKFVCYLLSRMVQKNLLKEPNILYTQLAEPFEPNEFLTKHFAKTPIKELRF